MIGHVYVERGLPVTVLIRWGTSAKPEPPRTKRAPRNVLIRRADGTRVVRPFRGLRRLPIPRTSGGKPAEGTES